MIGWLLDTNVISTIINPNGAPTVKAWAAAQNESRFFLSILALGEYDKGIYNLPDDHPNRPRFIAARDGLAARFAGRIVSLGDAVVRRWGVISGTTKRLTGHSPPVIDTLLAATALEHDYIWLPEISPMCGRAERRSSIRGWTIRPTFH